MENSSSLDYIMVMSRPPQVPMHVLHSRQGLAFQPLSTLVLTDVTRRSSAVALSLPSCLSSSFELVQVMFCIGGLYRPRRGAALPGRMSVPQRRRMNTCSSVLLCDHSTGI